MSTTGARIRDGRVARLARNTGAERMSPAAEPSPAHTPYRLLWSTGIVALVLGIAAFVLWGTVFFSHQLGSFLGGWGAGRLYDIQGNYDMMWWISVGLGLFAAVIHWCIRERPVPRLAMAAAPA